MSDEDLIKRGEVKSVGVPATAMVPIEAVAIEDIDNVPPAPHELTAKELLLIEERLFLDKDAYQDYLSLLWHMEIDEAVAYAQKWAEEHPEERSEDNAEI